MSHIPIKTYTGKKFFPFNPHEDQIDILDIAHGLSQMCRFCGHTPIFYSVAEHCVKVAELLPPELQLTGLLHDAAEAYISDIPKPVKDHLCDYMDLEFDIESVISKKFGTIFPVPKEVKLVDQEICKREQEYLWDVAEMTDVQFRKFGVPAADARREFLARFLELQSKES